MPKPTAGGEEEEPHAAVVVLLLVELTQETRLRSVRPDHSEACGGEREGSWGLART